MICLKSSLAALFSFSTNIFFYFFVFDNPAFFRGILCFSDVFNLKSQLYFDRFPEISTSALNSWIRSFYRVGPFGDHTLGDPI